MVARSCAWRSRPTGGSWPGERMTGTSALWDLAADRLLYLATLHDGHVHALAFSLTVGSSRAAAPTRPARVRAVERPADIAANAGRSPGRFRQLSEDRTLRDPDSEILSLAFTPDGTRLVAGATSRAPLIIWRLSDGHVLRRIAGCARDARAAVEGQPGIRRGDIGRAPDRVGRLQHRAVPRPGFRPAIRLCPSPRSGPGTSRPASA